jgi:hypothetical protein
MDGWSLLCESFDYRIGAKGSQAITLRLVATVILLELDRSFGVTVRPLYEMNESNESINNLTMSSFR